MPLHHHLGSANSAVTIAVPEGNDDIDAGTGPSRHTILAHAALACTSLCPTASHRRFGARLVYGLTHRDEFPILPWPCPLLGEDVMFWRVRVRRLSDRHVLADQRR